MKRGLRAGFGVKSFDSEGFGFIDINIPGWFHSAFIGVVLPGEFS
jgi:hypothetical protein